jgi:hypothetical protein
MLTGLKGVLAFEHEITLADGLYNFAHFCLWAANKPIGQYEDVVMLEAVQAQLDRLLLLSPRRALPELFEKSPIEIFYHLHDALYCNHEPKVVDAFVLRYEATNLTELGISSFDNLFVFLVNRQHDEVLTWRHADGEEPDFAILPPMTFDITAKAYQRHLQELGAQ